MRITFLLLRGFLSFNFPFFTIIALQMYLLSSFSNQDLKSQFKSAWCITYDYANDGQSKLGFKQGFSLKRYNNTIDNKEVHIYKHINIYIKMFEQWTFGVILIQLSESFLKRQTCPTILILPNNTFDFISTLWWEDFIDWMALCGFLPLPKTPFQVFNSGNPH